MSVCQGQIVEQTEKYIREKKMPRKKKQSLKKLIEKWKHKDPAKR